MVALRAEKNSASLALSGDREGGGIFTVELYRKVRLACRDGMSERAAARHFGVSRESVKKMLSFSVPPGYRRSAPVRRPKLDGFTGIIDGWLEGDREVHRKQRHMAKPLEHPLRRVPLLGALVKILPQPLIDDPGEPIQLRPLHGCRSPGSGRNRERHHLADAVTRDVEMTRSFSLAHPLGTGQSNFTIRVHGENPPAPPVARKGKVGRLLRRPQQGHTAATVADFLTAILSVELGRKVVRRQVSEGGGMLGCVESYVCPAPISPISSMRTLSFFASVTQLMQCPVLGWFCPVPPSFQGNSQIDCTPQSHKDPVQSLLYPIR